MPKSYKIRLADGSEIGPMDLQAVRDWHRQGFIDARSGVLRPGSKRWTTLDQVLEPQAFAKPGRAKAASARGDGPKPAAGPSRQATRGGPEAEPVWSRLGSALPWRPLAFGLLGAVALCVGGYFAYERFLAETPAERRVREASTGERRFSDESLGYRLDLPRGWLVLRRDSDLLPAPPEARVTFAEGRAGTVGFLTVESAPDGIASLDQYLDRLLERRRRAVAKLETSARSETRVGGLAGRQTTSAWSADGTRFRERATVWKDGWVYFAVACWAPEEAGERAGRQIDALLGGFTTSGDLDARMRRAVELVTREVPLLTAPAAERLMARSQAQVLEPDQAFRRGIEALTQALAGWTPTEVREVGQITSAIYATLSDKDRNRLASYLGRVRNGGSTSPQEDREMGRMMKTAVLRLPAPRRLRLQALCEKAVLTAPTGA